MKKRLLTQLVLIGLLTLTFGYFSLPYDQQKSLFPFTPESLAQQKINLGLDLQGGSQLDYKIDLRRVDSKDQEQIIEGVLEVINKRVNGLGVAEPNIYRSKVGDEEHIVVELAGIKDLEEAKATVGKTIQLEFKEENHDPMTADMVNTIKRNAQNTLDRILDGEDFSSVAEEESLANPSQVQHFAISEGEDNYSFKSTLPTEYFPALDELELGTVIPNVIQTTDGYTFDETGNLAPLEGFFLVKLNN